LKDHQNLELPGGMMMVMVVVVVMMVMTMMMMMITTTLCVEVTTVADKNKFLAASLDTGSHF
jgi:uncharacterized membrane protein YjgN (DUF898 family)